MSVAPRRPNVWVVDDSPLDAERARRALNKAYGVEVFTDGSAVLERLASEPAPEVLVLDWVMPGVSGLEVCRFLRTQGGGAKNLGILLLTSHRDTSQIVEGLSAGANDYLAKPYAEEELLARTGALVRSRQLLRRAELAEDAIRRLLETSPDPLLVLDDDHRTSFANEQAALAFGRSTNELRSRRLSELLPQFPLSALEQEASDKVKPLPELQVGERQFSVSARVLPPNDVARSILSLRDVTEQRRLDERRLDFYSVIAHDLRSPLNILKLRLNHAARLTSKGETERVLNDLHKMDTALDGLVEMINDFLELASLEGASHRLKRTEIDLQALIAVIVDDVRPLLDSRGQHYEAPVLPPHADVRVLGDTARLSQVLSNLLTNAIKFTPPEGRIKVSIDTTDGHVRVSVSDSGCGIPVETIPRLFQRYQRAEQSHASGTGLGLLIVREIIEAHHGSVGVESQVGEGSRFWFELPRAPACAPEGPHRAPHP
jgi:signal transduction histidine kinase